MNDAGNKISVPFEVKNLHIKALLKLLACHHSGITLNYSQLSQEIGAAEKTKSWQCEAWKVSYIRCHWQ
jgi:hypothetical protein